VPAWFGFGCQDVLDELGLSGTVRHTREEVDDCAEGIRSLSFNTAALFARSSLRKTYRKFETTRLNLLKLLRHALIQRYSGSRHMALPGKLGTLEGQRISS
jgi:hypothetical protein